MAVRGIFNNFLFVPNFNTVPAVNAAYFFNMRHILMCAGFYVVVNFVFCAELY